MDCCNRKSKSRSNVSDRFEAMKLRTRLPSSAKARTIASETDLSSIVIHFSYGACRPLARHATRISDEIKRHAANRSFKSHGYRTVRIDHVQSVIAHIFGNSILAVAFIFPGERVGRFEIARILDVDI